MKKLPIELLNRDEVDRLMKTCSRRSPSGVRDRALIAVLAGAGLRIADEALGLRYRHVDAERGALTVASGKGGKRRVVGIDDGSFAVLQDWLEYRERLVGTRAGPIFCVITNGSRGLPLDPANVRQMLARRRTKAGIEKRVHAHGFRHYHAADLAACRLPINVIQAELGHSNAATTSRWLPLG